VYSDLGFMILGAWIERVTARPLDEAFADRVAYRLGLDDPTLPALGFRRLFSAAALRWELERRIAPTEVYDAALHPDAAPSYLPVRAATTSIAHGAVHDDNAWVMGGVAGHAGLFGTAAAVLEVGRAWLEGILPGIEPALRDRFWLPSAVPASTRRLGWDGPSPDGTGATANAMSPTAVGHTGFTGTSLWIDPPARHVAVLLTNRVHPVRTDDRIKPFRQRFHTIAAHLR
jgi:CubicO group peptidase (beta-lactamase class C family)